MPKKRISELIPMHDRVFYQANDVASRRDLTGQLDGTVLEVHCDRGDCWIVTVSGVHRKHMPQFEYELVPDGQGYLNASNTAYADAMVAIPGRGTVVKGRGID